jgi:hypothetical protein
LHVSILSVTLGRFEGRNKGRSGGKPVNSPQMLAQT